MTPAESETVRAEISALTARAEMAERCAQRAEAERDHLRAILARSRTSLTELFNDPAVAS